MGSAGLCIRKISQNQILELERSIRDELLQINADFTYLGEFSRFIDRTVFHVLPSILIS